MPAHPSQSQLKRMDRLPIHRDEHGVWDLVVAAGGLAVEFASPAGVWRFTPDHFETSPDGQRIANSLTVALAGAPLG
jgi:hypothetical protein